MLLPLIRDFPTESLFNDLFNTSMQNTYPPLDIKEDTNRYIILADLPGIDRKNINIESVDSKLELSVSVTDTKEEGEYLLKERRTTSFKRSIYLGRDLDRDSIMAKLENGILTVEISKLKPEYKKIEIK
jgi:HSP20 family protein